MGWRLRLVALLVGLGSFSLPALATPATHEKAVKGFFQAANMGQIFDGMAVQMTDMQVAANPMLTPFRESIVKFLKKYMNWQALEGDMVKIYMKEFSEVEIIQMTKFYGTPVGQKVLKKMPELTAAGAALGQQKLALHADEFQAILLEAQKKNEAAAKK